MNLLGIDKYLSQFGIDYQALLIICLIWGMGGAFISLSLSRAIAKLFMGVQLIDESSGGIYSQLYKLVAYLSEKAGLEKIPEVGVYDSPEINAFATGPSKNKALVAVSTGLLRNMDMDEIAGVLGHEISHIANGDMVTMTLIQGIINAFVMFLARIIAFVLSSFLSRDREEREFNPFLNYYLVMFLQTILSLLGSIVVAWFSRMREYKADEGGALLAGKQNMINALERLREAYDFNLQYTSQNSSLSTLKISGKKGGFLSLFATHPPLEDRIEHLKKLNIINR